MADVFEPSARSYVMSQIKKKDTKPELVVRRFLFKKGYRYRLHDKKLPGNPDIVLKKHRSVITINGCFWHAHKECKYNRMPKSNRDYWIPKIEKNVSRDRINLLKLRKLGWNVLR